MASYKNPSFQDRAAAAAKAKQFALDQLRNKPRPSEEKLAEQRQAWDAQQQVLLEQRDATSRANEAAKAEKAAAKVARSAEAKAAAELKAARLRPASAEEMKAARDARYAARKARK